MKLIINPHAKWRGKRPKAYVPKDSFEPVRFVLDTGQRIDVYWCPGGLKVRSIDGVLAVLPEAANTLTIEAKP